MTTSTSSLRHAPAPPAAEFSREPRYKTNRTSPVRWIISHFTPYWWLGLMIMLGAAGNAYLAALVPIEIGKVFDFLEADITNFDPIIASVWFIVWSQILRGFIQFFRNFGSEWLGQFFERNIREELYTSLIGKSMTFHNLQPVGDTMARATNDVREVNLMFSPGINMVIGSFYFLLMPIFISPQIHPDLWMVPVGFFITYFFVLWGYLSKLQPITDAVRLSFGKLNTRLAEALDGIETVKGMAQEASEIVLFEENTRRFRDAFVKQGEVEARFVALLILGIGQGLGLLHSLILFHNGELSVGGVAAYFAMLRLWGFPTWASIFGYSQVSLGIAGARRILDLINTKTDLDQNLRGTQMMMRGSIKFRDVCFAYTDSDPILKNVSFEVKSGQTVAIVGQTGSGKTTLAKLVNRTYDIEEGKVTVDGLDVRDWTLASLRQQISIIEQDIFLFSRTIAENIAFGHPHATQEQIEAAAQAAQAHDFILDFKDGYQTVIGERGVTLSGGQRQRLALARAFLTDPRILILDDSTSAIDSATEDKIQQAIYNAAKGRTTLIITHRLSQIRWADLIVVMRNGEVAAAGTHEELLASSEAYRRIFTE